MKELITSSLAAARGLTFALKAPHGRVAILTKKHLAEANTQYARGIAAVTKPTDSVICMWPIHCGLARGYAAKIVRTIVEEGPARVEELIDLGMEFTRGESISADGERFFARQRGQAFRDGVACKDATGREICGP